MFRRNQETSKKSFVGIVIKIVDVVLLGHKTSDTNQPQTNSKMMMMSILKHVSHVWKHRDHMHWFLVVMCQFVNLVKQTHEGSSVVQFVVESWRSHTGCLFVLFLNSDEAMEDENKSSVTKANQNLS